MKNFLYLIGYSIINWLEATVMLLTLGHVAPTWLFKYALWHFKKYG